MVSKEEFSDRGVSEPKVVLQQIVHNVLVLRDNIVIIGGWSPTFLLPQSSEPHIGSLDIDVALNFARIPDNTYRTILETFLKRGYMQDKQQPFRFFRTVKVEGRESIVVEIDLMAGEYGGTGKGHRTQKVQDVCARKARGCDLAFDSTVTVTIEGVLPDGGRDRESFKVAGIVPFLVMNDVAMEERIKEKDAYDIY